MMKLLLLLLCVLMPLCSADTDIELLTRIEALERRCEEQEVNSKKYEEHQTLVTSELTQEVASLRKLLSNNEKHLKDGLMAQINRTSRALVDGSETVAFHATLGGGMHTHYHVDQTIIFDQVLLNMGNGYHAPHGLFIAPRGGLYIFSVSIMTWGGANSIQVFIMKGGKEIASAIADGRGDAPHDQGSTTVVLQLNPGDEVWASVERHDDTQLYADGNDSFMGCLITPL